MRELLPQRSATVSNSANIGPSGGPRAAIWSSSTVQRVAVCRPESGKAAAPETARRARSGARLVRALAAVCLILLGTFGNALPAQAQATKPSAPQELTAVTSPGGVDLAWSAPTDDGGFDILRYEIRHAKGASVPNDTAWTELQLNRTYYFAGLDNGEQYSFEVRAVSVQGPGPAAPIQATPGDPPSAPQELTARASAGRVDLAWSAPTDDGGFDILRYEIRHAKGASVPNDTAWTELQLYRTYFFAGAGIDNGEQYSFEVRAVSVQGPGPAALIQATPGGPPTAPEGLSAAPGDRQAVLSWSAPENDNGSAVTDYEVRHAEGATVPANTAWTSVGLVTTHTVTGLDNGELHSFEVRAVSTRGGGRAARIQATPATKPSAPQELTARASAGRVDLTWSAPADDGGFDILRYEIRHAKGASVPNDTAWTELELHTTYFFASLDNGEQYSFEVRAVSVQGPGPATLIQATSGGPPSAPEGLSAAPGDRQAVLSWSAPENDDGSAVTDYEVRHAEGATVPANTAWTSVGFVTTHTVTGLDNGELHSFEVRAVSTRGGGRAARIQATPATKPSAPQELTARASAGRVDLAWSAPADDGGFDILRYEIRHAKGASVPNDTAWTELQLRTTYFFASLDNGEQYSFEVRAVSVQGPGPAALIQATLGEPPTAPEGLSATPGDRQAVLSWSAPENEGGSAVTGYEVRHVEGATVPANTAWTSVGLVTSHTVTGLDNGELHSFEVRAVSTRGGGRVAQIQTTPATKPSAPQELTARASAGRVDLAWSAPADDGGFDILRYEIRHAKGASVPNDTAWTELQLHTTYFFAGAGIDNGEQYSFEVRAVSVQGPGPAALIQATPGGPPTAPEGLSATPGDRQAVLSWSAPENEGGSAVTDYEVRHAEGATVPANTAWTSVGLVTTHTVTGLDNGELHSFEVRAVSTRGGGRVAQIQTTPATKPSAPQELTARASAGRVDLAWSAPADDGGFDILRYEIRHAKGASVPNDTAWTELQLYRTYFFAGAGIDNGEQYSFEVRAVSVQGPGPAALIQATPGGPPTAPEGLSAAPGDRQAVLSWSAPENDNGSAVTDYEVRHAEGATVPANTAWTSVGLVTTHTVTGLDNGELHSFEVRAVSTRGGGRAARIQATPATKPSAPQELTARASAGQVDLAWSAPTDDGGFDILRYEIRHAKGASVPNDTAWTELELHTTYFFASLNNGEQYSFEVRAVSVQGPGPAALIQATPGDPPTAPEGLSATPGDRQAVLSWSAPENDGGSAVTDYEVRHAEGATVPANTAWTSVELVTTHTVTGLDNGELHSFEVRAVSTRGGGRAARIQATPATKPSAPQELTAVASAGRVDLAWSAPADDGGFDILRYEIRHAKGASVPNDTAWTELELHTTYFFASLNNGEQYSFEVRAVSVQGPGPAALIQATPGGPPTAPEGLSAAPGDRQAVLSWSAPENDGGSAVTDYEVRHAEGATVPANTAWTSVGLVTTHTVTGLDNGELHSFEVRAVSTRGGGRAARIQATPATKPSAPQELTAVASAGRVDLAWSAPADDGGFDILRYEIRHAKGASVPNDTAWTELELHTTYFFASLDNGEQYSFEVRAVSVQGPGPAALIQATSGGPPTAPEGLSATPGDRQAVLSWSAPENEGGSAVTDYEVRHAEGATVPANTAWTSVGLVTTHTVTGLDNGELHSFEVRAVSTRGGGRVARIQATPATKPSAPQELTAVASAGRVDLTWSAPADDGGFDILRYEIRHAKGASVPNDTAWTELQLHTTYFFASLDNGEQYSFEVRAVSVQGPGPAALIQATSGGPPTAPEGLSAAPGDRQAVLSWSAPENDGGSAVTDYEVRHAEDATVPANTAWTSVELVTTHTVTGLDNGELHSFEVRAVSARGGGRAAQIQATPATKPSAPQELTAVASAGRVDLAWSAPADDGGFDILRYEIRHAKGASVPNDTAWTELELHTTYFFASLNNGEQYSFEVRAVSVQGPGPAALIQATPGGPPTAPEGLSAAPGDRQAVLSWSAPENEGGSAVTDYEVRHAEGATVPANTAWTSVGLVTTHTVTGLDNGELHSFEVRAVSGVGSSATVAAMATPGTTVTVAIEPDAPRDFTAVPGDGRVTLRWRAPANDGGSAVSHYQYRYAAGNSVPSGTSWESVQNAHTVMVEGLDNGTQYAFEVRAVNGVGPSATAAATASPATPATPSIEPDAPRDFKAVAGDGRVTLRWRAPANDGGSAVSHYQYRYAAGNSVPSGTPWKSVQNALTVTVDGLDNGTQYVFELRAVNGVGPGATAAATATPAIEPDAPRDFTAVPGDGRVTLRWRAPANDGGSAVSHYQYRYAAGNSVPSGTPWKSVQNALTVTVDGLDNGTQYVFELRAVNAVGPSAAVTATATLSEGPAVAELQRHIAGFMLNRANALANSQPRLTRFLKDGRPANSLAGQGTEHAGAIRGSLQVQGFWLDVNGAMSNAADARSRYLFGSVGGHWRVNERLLAGVMLQLDTADETLPGQAGDIAGKGSMVGPYFAAKLEGQPLYLEGRLLYGQTENRLAHSRGVTGEFGTARWLAQLRMEGNVALDAGLALTPFADLTGARDRQRGFTDSLERQVGGQTVSLGQAKFGVDFRLPLHVEQGNLALTGGAAGVFSSTDSGAAGAGVEAARARLGLGLGLDYSLDDTYSFEVKGNYDGIGARDYQSFGLRGDLKIRF